MNPTFIAYGVGAFGVVVGAVVGGRYLLKNRREGDKVARLTPLPPTWPEMWERMDKLEKRIETRDKAFGNILGVIASAWPKGAPRPVFAQEDLDALADTIPAEWLHPTKEQT